MTIFKAVIEFIRLSSMFEHITLSVHCVLQFYVYFRGDNKSPILFKEVNYHYSRGDIITSFDKCDTSFFYLFIKGWLNQA